MRLRSAASILAVTLAGAGLFPWLLPADDKVQDLARSAAEALKGGTPKNAAAPAPGPTVPKPARQAAGNPLVPDWVRPGLRLTYYLITGSVSGSTNGLVPDKDGGYTDRNGNHYAAEGDRVGHSSHGLVEATVAGMDGRVVALSQPFYLFSGTDTTPMLNSHQDMLVTADTGGDLWMHPRRQALMQSQHPWAGAPRPGRIMARTTTWRKDNQSWAATEIVSLGETGKTYWVYEQASGRLLYLSRISRQPPEIRNPSQSLPDSVSYATILRFVGVRQLNLPWMDMPLPEWTRQLQALSYRGRSSVQFPGSAPGGQALSQDMQVAERGGNWLLFQMKGQAEAVITGSESKGVTGPGCSSPIVIPPAALERLRPGQEIDRDPHTRYAVRVGAVDQQTVTLLVDGGYQTMTFAYERAQGVLLRTFTRERSTAGTNMFLVREMQLAGKR